MPYVLADTEEAREHVREIEAQGWPHSLSGCPPMCRAMCSYAVYVSEDVAQALEAREEPRTTL